MTDGLSGIIINAGRPKPVVAGNNNVMANAQNKVLDSRTAKNR